MGSNLKIDGFSTRIIECDNMDLEGFARGPERNLLSALLFDGIQAYFSYCLNDAPAMKDKYSEAFRWVQSNDTEYIFSFMNVCEALGIEPSSLRLGLLNYVNSNKSLAEANTSAEQPVAGNVYRKSRRQSP